MYLELDDYNEYSDELNPVNQAKVQGLAMAIASSQLGPDPVRTINVIGHADRALRLPAEERQAKEMEVSVRRASKAVEVIKSQIAKLPGGDGIVAGLQFVPSGVGSQHRKILNPANQSEMRQNRRVEITTLADSGAIIHVLPDWPRYEPNVEEPPLDKVFSFKLMEGVAAGVICQYTFVVWDKSEAKAGAFDYRAFIRSAGAASPFAGESDWADLILPPTVTLQSIDGAASHAIATLPFGFMLLNIPKGSVVIPLGLNVGIAVEAGDGLFTLARDSIRPFNGD